MTETLEFGPFRLAPARRELFAHGVPLMLGQRAFDVLLALVNRPGQLVTKDEIMAEVWPGAVVDENNLQVHVSALRKVLQAAGDGERYLVTVAGRGYRFVAPVAHVTVPSEVPPAVAPVAAKTVATPAVTLSGHNLPQQVTPLIGREAELAGIRAALAEHRVVTLTGTGGVGKTRLAIEAGRSLLPAYADGVWLVELAPVQDAQLVPSILAEVLQISASAPGAVADSLAAALNARQLLLILDNCEHVIGEAASLAEALVRKCPRLSILAASRERLAIAGESVIRVPSLPAPEPGIATTAADARRYPAVKLFTERAAALGVDFALTDANAGAVASICRRLDGIPLAIELAVPRLKVLSIHELERRLDERFKLLTGGSRTALSRQQTLQALIDWSYALLTEQEKLLLARLSVFLGGTTLASIEAVTAGPELAPPNIGDLLLSLVEKSLVVSDARGPETRYSLLESTRLYALSKLEDSRELSRRHCTHFAARLADAAAAWETTPTHLWLERFAADIDNLRAALTWSFGPNGDKAMGLQLVGASHVLWAELGLFLEHRHWTEPAFAHVDKNTPPAVTARLLSWQAGEVREIGDPADHNEALRAAALFHKLGDGFAEGRMLFRAGTDRLLPDQTAEGERLLRKALALLRPSGSTKTLARCLAALASAQLFAGDAKEARSLHQQAITVYRELGERLDGDQQTP